ncbi:hypothetical protein AYI69_g3712 [Smittium culicis]|uniref:Uncharacterized protein n=1 Tax=Smittium culicis TaxID=133412 RepID=A0A1R1YJ06_9FUNG|nr:hypothetical protein AYI69_g3712 [Smittium culicis]
MDETFTIEIDGKNYSTQIYSLETLFNNEEILFEGASYTKHDDSLKLIMYTSIKAELQDYENTESNLKIDQDEEDELKNKIQQNVNEKELKVFQSMIKVYSHMFVNSPSQLSGIINSEYSLNIIPGAYQVN